MPRYVRCGVTVAPLPTDALIWKRWFSAELGLVFEIWELGRLPEKGAWWYLRGLVRSLTRHLETLKPWWSRLAQCLL